MNIAESDASTYPSLKSAKQLLQQKVQGFFSDPNTLEKLHGIFPGATAGAGDEWRTNAQGLINNILSNRYAIDVELLSNTEMAGAMGAFAGVGYNGKPVIYINADWLSLNPDSTFVSRVLAEEFGHSLDFSLNSIQDTAGDEGFKFALELFGSEGIDTSRLEAGDHETLRVHGAEILVEEASVTFQAAYMGTPSAWSLEASSIKLTSKVNAILNGIKFISGDPNAQYFSGNNVAGSLVYSNSSGTVYTINGIISRQFKSGATTNAFYFYATGANGVVDSNGGDDSAYLLHVVGNSTTIVYDGTSNASYTTSSDPVDTALNNIKDSTQPSLTATTSSTAGALPAIEAGGTANSTAGQDGSGNVITGLYTNFTGTNPPTIISAGVTAASQTAVAALSTSTSNFTAIIANFGTLQIGANGTYLYKVDNTNTSVQALRLSSDTLTDTFAYTAKDSAGNIASTTLTVTIQGKNDAPVALNDSNTAKIGGTAVTGNVLANDSDVDKLGETINLLGLVATADLGSYTAGTTTLNFTTSNGISSANGDYAYYLNAAGTIYYPLYAGATPVTAIYSNPRLSLSADPTNFTIVNGTRLGFFNRLDPSYAYNVNGLKYADVTSTTSSATISLTNIIGSIVVGMTVTGTNIPSGALVSSISGTNIVFSKSPTGTPGSMTFTAIGGATVTGIYGTLVFNADGKGGYIYTPNAGTGSGGTDTFTYKAVDAASLQSNTGTLTINVLANTATNPTAGADTATITENASPNTVVTSTQATGLLGNDTTPSGTTISGVVAARASADASETSISSGSTVTFNGKYGTLALKSDGTYTYTLNNANPDVNSLNSGQSLTDLFYYRIQNNGGSGNQDTSTLTVTINGANDAPVLKLDAISSTTNFSSSYTPTYTVNNTTVNAVPAPLTSTTGMHLTDVDNTFFSKLTLSYTQSNFADGSYEQLLFNGATGTNTSISSLGTLANGATGSFTLNSLGYSYSTVVSGGVATITFTASAASTAFSQAQVETLLTAFKYQNTSPTNPTTGSGRVFTITTFDNGANNSTTLASSGTLSSNTATATITVYSTSTAPSATNDTVTAVEAGTTVGTNPTGNVLTGETSNNTGTKIGDSGAGITVTKVKAGSSSPFDPNTASTVAANSTSSSSPTSLNGSYGTLNIGADGSYSYTVNNANSAVDALKTGQSLTDTFTYQITDTSNNTATATITVTINGANDAPVLTDAGGTLSYTTGSGAAVIDSSLTITDVDDTNIESATITVSSGYSSTDDRLSFTNANGIVGLFDEQTGILTLTGTATKAQYEAALESITFSNNNIINPSTVNRTISWVINDGESNSPVVTSTITVTQGTSAVNSQPVITNLDAAIFFENAINATPAFLDTDITLTDTDSPDFNGGSLTVGGLDSSDRVALPTTATDALGNIRTSGSNVQYYNGSAWVTVGTYSGGSGTDFIVSFTNTTATRAVTERIIENLTFANVSNNPTLTRTLTLAVDDGDGQPIQNDGVLVTIKLDNDAPNMTATTLGGTYLEQNSTPLQFVGGTITVSDPDAETNFYNSGSNIGSLTVSLATYLAGDTLSILDQGTGSGQIGVSGSTVSYEGTDFASFTGGSAANLVITFTSNSAPPTAIQALLARLTYSNLTNNDPTNNNAQPTRSFTITLNDGNNTKDASSSSTALSTILTGTINITTVNDIPVQTGTTPTAISVLEDSSNSTAVTLGMTLLMYGPGGGSDEVSQTLTYTITAIPSFIQVFKANGTTQVSATDTLTLSELQGLKYKTIANLNGTANLTWTVQDNGGTANGGVDTLNQSLSITVGAVNDAPTVANPIPDQNATEDISFSFQFAANTFADVDVGDTLTYSVQLNGGGALPTWLTFNSSTRTFSGTPINADVGTITIDVTADDGNGGTVIDTFNIVVANVNDDPVVTTTSGTTPFTEGNNATSTPVVVDSGITVTDADNNTLASATVTITSNFQSSEDTLGFTNTNSTTFDNISATYNSGTGVLTLTSSGATATLAQWEAALRAVTYTNTSQTPNTSTRTISFVVNDGTSNSNTATKDVSVTAVNDAPVVTTTSGTTPFTEGNNVTSTPVAVDSGITVTDADNNTLASATVTITSNFQSSEDVLGLVLNSSTMGNITASYASGVLTLTSSGATATVAQWQAALQAITYTNTSQTPNTSTRTISFVVNDGTSNSNTATKDVSLTAVNDAPVVNAPAVIQVTEDVITVLTGISFSDQDAGSGQVTANFAVPSGTLYATSGGVTVLGSGTGNLTLSGSVADINTFIASNNFSFQTTPNNTATVTLTIGINDNGNSGGSAQTNSTTVNLQVISVADVINVTSPTANGHYKAGDVITVTVQFDEPVFVNTSGGIPDLVLETGTIDRNAVYTSGSGTSTLTFTYTVQPGDTTPDLDYVSSISLGLNGGTIQNNTAINATLALPNPGTTGSLGANKEIVIDTTPPSVGPIDITNGTDSGTNDTITNNGSPVIIFTGETGLTISLLGADGSILLTPVTQYTVIETPNGNGTSTYTVTLLDANGNLNDGNQPFGTYLTTFPNIGNPTNNGGSVADGIYTIKATDIAGNQSTVGTFTIDTTPPGLSPGVGPINITNGTDSGPDDTITNNGNPVLTFTGEQGLTITLYGPDGTQLIFGTHYTFSYTSGTYTVNLLDAVPGGQANTFGSFNNGAPTGNLPSVADGLYTIKATDVAGNQSTVETFTIDTTAPSVVVTSNLSTLVSNQTATITFTFSENPIGFTNTDVIVNGGTISGFTSTADPKVYSGIFTPSPNSTANGTISVSIGSYTDLANNPGASDSTSIMVDTLGPSLAISSDKPELEYHQTAAITFSFSELPVGFDLVDITLTGGTLSNLKASPINQTIYTALFTPTIDFIGDGLISVANGRFTDSLGNLGTGGNISPAINIFNKIRGFTATGDNSSFVGPELGNSSSSDGTSVVLYNPSTGESRGNVVPFPGYTGQVRISRADTNNDSILDMVVSPDAGYAPLVKIIDSSNGSTIAQFNAYDRNFTGGLYVSVADVNNDGFAEIITGAGFGGGPHVKVFDEKTHNEVASFFAYDLNFRGGVSVATFDFDRDGILDVVTGAGPGGGPM